jgi:flagellar biosynthesis chaperone FliJ
MKSLSTLIKLQKTRVDEQRLALTRLQGLLEEIERNIAKLEVKKAHEQVAAQESAEARATYGAFLKAVVTQGRDFEKQRAVMIEAIEIARQKLRELFEEQKRYEIAEVARLAAEQKEERRKETMELDEIGAVTFTRKKTD